MRNVKFYKEKQRNSFFLRCHHLKEIDFIVSYFLKFIKKKKR